MNTNLAKAWEYYAQSEYFIQAASLVSKDVQKNKNQNPTAYNNFEAVIVGTHHAFSAEILLKGYMLLKDGSLEEGHFIDSLLDYPSCGELKTNLQQQFAKDKPYSYNEADFSKGITEFINGLDLTVPRERKASENVKAIVRQNAFGTFEYFLKLHSNNFVLMRYACEKSPLPVDLTFTSFLVGSIRDEFKSLLHSE